MKFYTIYFLLLFLPLSSIVAQSNANPILNYKVEVANNAYERHQYVKASEKYGSLLAKGALDDEELARYAHVLFAHGKTDSCLTVLGGAEELSDLGFQVTYDAYMKQGDYARADSLLDVHQSIKMMKNDEVESIHAILESFPQGDDCLVTLMDFNSTSSDYGSVLHDDTLYFTSSRIGKSFWRGTYDMTGDFYQDIYRVDGDGVRAMKEGINTPYHDGPICFSEDGQIMIVCRNNYSFSNYGNQKEAFNELHLFKYSKTSDGEWSEPELLPFCQEAYYYTHPFIKENKLYFSSNVPGGYGLSDIYYATIDANGDVEKEIINVGEEINTKGSEGFPFMNDDDEFYFSSDGHLGFGGLDMFKYAEESDSFALSNMGAKFNTTADDFAFIEKDDKTGYFSSNREGGKGDDDIYHYQILSQVTLKVIDGEIEKPLSEVSFHLSQIPNKEDVKEETGDDGIFKFYVNEEFDQAHVFVEESEDYYEFDAIVALASNMLVVPLVSKEVGVMGYVYNEQTGERYGDISVQIIDDDGQILENYTDANGAYRQMLMRDKEYHIVVDKEFFFSVETLLSTVDTTGWLERNFPLSNMMELKGINYDLDKHDIRPDAASILDEMVELLQTYPWINIELASHTDSRGSNRYNELLSQRRSDSAVRYIVSKGISSSRLVTKGYGETQIKNKCTEGVDCSPEEHHENRRTEIRMTN